MHLHVDLMKLLQGAEEKWNVKRGGEGARKEGTEEKRGREE